MRAYKCGSVYSVYVHMQENKTSTVEAAVEKFKKHLRMRGVPEERIAGTADKPRVRYTCIYVHVIAW